ncbi:alpha/beta fold hydrolase [Streptomyces sp. MP131-18]|uniref:alpha/beta hydrolase n=1 Tax=Streptomyces sp. MP131-18 TaxID=1857892 RepID=UPI00097CA6A3|nr:alpha/beta fold hydrolase [Streptomyces sp. MP131-18]ONK14208.1 fermentation/respiration switch protein [Streptomyces sp. MP131-18]
MGGQERETSGGRASVHRRRQLLALGGAAATAGLLLQIGTARAASAAPADADGVTLRRVTFTAPDGVRLAGHLRIPHGGSAPRPAIVVSNAMTSVKEQSVNAGYAQGLASAGFVTLVFDQRRFGESGGTPRQHEANQDRLADLHVAVSYLASLTQVVDAGRIGAIGVSIGGGLAMNLTAYDPRVRAFVAVAAGLLNPARARELIPAYDELLADQTAQLERYHSTGRPEYIPVVRTPDVPDDQPVLFDNPIATEYYGTARGAAPNWQNRATALSLRTILVDDTRTAADTVGPRAGMLIVGDQDVSTLPEDHQAVHARLTGPRRIEILPGVVHNDLYDRDAVRTAVGLAAEWFGAHLS